jgi:hypothetical protein
MFMMSETQEPRTNTVCLTLYEGDYVWGVGALANSLYRVGFRGTLVVGYRGELPAWMPLAQTNIPEWQVAPGFQIMFWKLPEGAGIHQLKPYAMIRVLDEIAPAADRICFFDADVIVLAKWQYFEALVEAGVALVLDHWFTRVAMAHPWRRTWAKLCTDAGFTIRPDEDYFISAFCGVSRRYRAVIDAWWRLTLLLQEQRPELGLCFKPGERMTDSFHGTDQDLLAAAVMATEVPICPLGPEAFGFTGSAQTMLHPMSEKPWRTSALAQLLRRGRKPDLYTRNYWRYLDAPIVVRRRAMRWLQRLDVVTASALARVYSGP